MAIDILERAGTESMSAPSVEGVLQFAERSAEKPDAYASPPPDGIPATRGGYAAHSVQILNARSFSQRLNLDIEGVAVVRQASAVGDFFDEAQTLALGHPETAELVKQVTGAGRVVVYDHTLRRRADGVNDRDPGQPRQPASRVHVDQTLWSGPKRVREIMGKQADALLARRAAIINVWRPIGYPARDWPLVLGDAQHPPR